MKPMTVLTMCKTSQFLMKLLKRAGKYCFTNFEKESYKAQQTWTF